MPNPPQPEQPSGKRLTGAPLAGLIAVVVAATAGTLTKVNEGTVLKPYLDPVGVKTVCTGETQNIEDRIYSAGECAVMLRTRMTRDYAPPLVKCVPDLADPAHAWQFGALLDFSYNAGWSAACKSPMARRFNAGDWAGGCKAFDGYYATARGRKLPGLVRRRREEMTYCLTGQRTAHA